MKNLINKYFNLVGIKHEGFKRISIIIIVLGMFFSPNLMGLDLDEYIDLLLFDRGLDMFLRFWSVLLIPFPIIFGIIVRTINWVIKGFNK